MLVYYSECLSSMSLSNIFPASKEYTGPYRWDEAKERTPNDYRTKDDKRNTYEGFASKEEENEYYDLLLTREEQGLPNYY